MINRESKPVNKASSPFESRSPSRLDINEGVIDSMKGAAQVAIVALGIAAQATQNVPYLGAISTALTEFMKIQDEVNECKEECRATLTDAQTMKTLIEKFRDKCVREGKGEGMLDGSLCDTFTELEGIVLECIIVLQKCKVEPKRTRDRLRLYLKRSALAKSAKDCSAKMEKALQRFNTTLQVDQVILLEHLQLSIDELREARSSNVLQVATPRVPSVWRLHAAPLIFYGREKEVDHALDLILHQAPARVAILGSGGIGKTSIALSILHHPDVEALYGDQRCFLSCEATITADGIVRALAEAIDLCIERDASPESAQQRLISYLKSVTGIVCLDNLETPWDKDTASVEDLLSEIASTPFLALMITSRVTDTPLIGWSSPPLKPIAPFSIEAALLTWDTICSGHDEYAVKVIDAVDRVPLAVTLLARLARTETPKTVWTRWELERTDIIQSHGIGHRLNNLSVSIELSLRALGYQEAIDVLAIICMYERFPGVRLSTFDDFLKDHMSFGRAVAILKQSSLVYTDGITWAYRPHDLLVLSPVRHHMQKHHPLSDRLFLLLVDMMMQDRRRWNCDVVFKPGILERQGICRERCLQEVISNPLYTDDHEVLSEAIREAHAHDLRTQAGLHRRFGWVLTHLMHTEYDKALSSFSKAIEIDMQLDDREMLFSDWKEWIMIFHDKFKGYEDERQHLEEVENIIQKIWDLGRDEDGVWCQDYGDYFCLAWEQHAVNEKRRRFHMPIICRSGLYMDNDSTVRLNEEPAYYQLVKTSSPPWDLSSILKVLGVIYRRSNSDEVIDSWQ